MTRRQYHLAKIDQKKKDKVAAGLVSEKFPDVSGMVINMTYYQKVANPVLMVRTLNVFPTDYAYFLMDCALKDCVDGGFDLTPVISELVRKRKRSASGSMVCGGENDFLPRGHASISYEINIKYRKAG